MKEATSLLQKIRSTALRRLLLDETRHWAFVACLLALLSQTSSIVGVTCLILLLCYTFFRATLFRRRVPTLYQTARRLEADASKIQGVLSASLEFESSSADVAFDSPSLRKATIDQARLWLENALDAGRMRELRDLALQRTQDVRRNRLVFLERIGTFCAASALVVHFVWLAPREKTTEPTTFQPTTFEAEKEPKTEINVDEVDVPMGTTTPNADVEAEFAFLRATLARSVALADSLTRELGGVSFDSLDSTLVFQLTREFDSEFTSSTGMIASVGKFRVSLSNLSERNVDTLLLARRLLEFDEYLTENQDVGAELTRLFATSSRSSSRNVRAEAFERARETLQRTFARLQVEQRALDFLAFGWEFSHKFADLERERAALFQDAVERLQARPGAISDVDASDLPTSEFLERLDAFAKNWNARRDELAETARRLHEPDAGEFVTFVTRFAAQTDSYAFLLGTERAQVDLPGRFERPLTSIRQIQRDACAERWGKAATLLSEAPNARDMLGAATCETDDFSSTLAWRLAFGVFDGSNGELKETFSNTEESRKQTSQNEIAPDAPTPAETLDALERMARAEESTSKLTAYSGETQTQDKINASINNSSQSQKTSEEGSAPDENYAGGASARETNTPLENGTNAFSGELPKVAVERLKSSKGWNPPAEYREKERAFQARLRAETRKNR